MEFNVAQLIKEPLGSTREYQLHERFTPVETASVCWLEGWVKLTRTDMGIWVHGSLRTSILDVCGRCLKEAEQEVAFGIDEEYFPSADASTGLPVYAPDVGEGAFLVDKRHILDLSEAVRQYTLAALPLKLLCRPDCQGLCPQCGVDKNAARCGCSLEARDHRWDSLREILSVHGSGR